MPKATFTWKHLSWNQEDIKATKDVPVKYVTAKDEREFSGDLAGWSTASYTMTYFGEMPKMECSGDGQCVFCGLQYVEGTLLGKKGSFAMEIRGVYDKGKITGTWLICPETTQGELKGMKGSGAFSVLCRGNEEWETNGHLDVEF